MPRTLASLAVLMLSCTLVIAVPAGSGASPVAHTAVKKKCKHRHHHRKRCRRKSPSASPTGDDGGSTGTTGPPGRLLATEKEISPTQLQLQLSRPSLAAGSAIVEQYNAGSDPHNLILEKSGQVAFAYPTLDPGGDQRQTVTLTRGTYTLYCSLLDHRILGMQATLTVN
jgi:plastocyanin